MKTKKGIIIDDGWMTLEEALFLLIAGLVIGTVGTFGMKYWNKTITPEEAIHKTAIFSSYKESRNRGNVQEIIVRFEDSEQLYIDGCCINQDLMKNISTITPGTTVMMIVHPNSNKIMQMETNTLKLLNFEESAEKLTSEARGFMYFGIFFYILAFVGLVSILFKKTI